LLIFLIICNRKLGCILFTVCFHSLNFFCVVQIIESQEPVTRAAIESTDRDRIYALAEEVVEREIEQEEAAKKAERGSVKSLSGLASSFKMGAFMSTKKPGEWSFIVIWIVIYLIFSR
jgi:hypothetical protein